MSYTIAFDFPDVDDPVFAGIAKGALGFAPSLATAVKFTTENAALKTLESGYSDGTRRYGCVVEVEQ